MPWTEQTIHFIDFEGSTVSGILEYGVVTLRGTQIIATATGLCRPTGKVRPEDVAVHGIVAAAVAGEAPFEAEFDRFVALRRSGPLAAHFAQAENTLIKRVWAYPPAGPDWVRPERESHEWGPWVDTGKLYPQLFPQLSSAKLGDVVAVAGLQEALDELAQQHCPASRRHYHAALYDALAGALLLLRLAADPMVAEKSLTWLLQMSTRDPVKREAMTQGDLF
jgi:DNA polymerase III epsilon subunit-like protein